MTGLDSCLRGNDRVGQGLFGGWFGGSKVVGVRWQISPLRLDWGRDSGRNDREPGMRSRESKMERRPMGPILWLDFDVGASVLFQVVEALDRGPG